MSGKMQGRLNKPQWSQTVHIVASRTLSHQPGGFLHSPASLGQPYHIALSPLFSSPLFKLPALFLTPRPTFLFRFFSYLPFAVASMTNQQQVLDIYLKVIDATVEGVRADFQEKSLSDDVLEGLDILKARWQARLTQTHEFSEDPQLVDRASVASSRGSRKHGGKAAKKKSPTSKPLKSSTPTARNGGIPVAALTNDADETTQLPSVPRLLNPETKSEVVTHDVTHDEVQEVPVQPPPAKRARTASSQPVPSGRSGNTANNDDDDDDDGRIDNAGEDLDSSDDSDVQGGDSDEDSENLVLAQHEKTRKGQKWKVHLREGIISVRGREYLFHRATCDLDF